MSTQSISALLQKINNKYQQNALAIDSGQTNKVQGINEDVKNPRIDKIAADNDASETLGIAEGEELILSINVDKYYLADIFAYKSKKNIQIGLTNFFEVLEFQIDVDLANGHASGWFINESNLFSLKISSNTTATVMINGKSFLLSQKDYQIKEDDIYIEIDQVATWFEMEFIADLPELTLTLMPKDPLPFQQRLERKNRTTSQSKINEAVLPWKESHHQVLSWPLADIQLYSSTGKSRDISTGYSIVGANDLAFMDAQYYASGQGNDLINDLRLNLTKEIDNKGASQWLPTHYEIGDITATKVGMGRTSGLSRGITISNHPTNTIINQETTNLSGNIQPGWDSELYHNGTLIDSKSEHSDGRYEYNDIPLRFGENELTIIFYGPQGQLKTKTENIVVNQNTITSGESFYQASLTQNNKTLFGMNTVGNGDDGWSLASKWQRGMNEWLSISLGQSYFKSDNGSDEQNYSLGSSLNLGMALFNAGISTNHNNDITYNISGRGKLGNHAISLNHNQSEANIIKDDIKTKVTSQKSSVQISGELFKGSFLPLSYQNDWLHGSNSNGESYTNIASSLSYHGRLFNLSNQLFWIEHGSLAGNLRLSSRWGALTGRLSINYALDPNTDILGYNSSFNWPLTDTIQSSLSLNYTPQSDVISSRLGMNWKTKYATFRTNINYNTNNDWQVLLSANFGFGYEGNNDTYFMTNRPITSSGALVARVYEDFNNNQLLDPGETLISNAKIKAVQSYAQSLTDENGIAVLAGMRKNRRTDIHIEEDSLPDPFLVSSKEGVSITPRAGFIEYIDFPMVTTSEVDGTIYIDTKHGKQKPASYVKVHLINEKDEIVATTETEFDGYYLFTKLLPGDYKLSIDSAYLKRKKLKSKSDFLLSLSSLGDIVNGTDLILSAKVPVNGYTINAGSFYSLNMLKVYWQLIRDRFYRQRSDNVFFWLNEESGNYQLNLGIHQDIARADLVCEELKLVDVKCSIEKFES